MLLWTRSIRRVTALGKMSPSICLAATLSPARPRPSLEIELTSTEAQLCTLLDDCTKHLRDSRPDLAPVECRIAGGWVRDKLLGLQSNDIDIALSTMMGVSFAEHLVSFLSTRGHHIKEAAKIARNPEQSKHLETAMVSILGLDIDLVNLRSEVYADESRIPSEVGFGTPLEDALRRDITINALFYNVHTRSVEDHTQKGLDDLKSGIIRTPLPPKETFMDDPLRVLRCVRFASRFEYELDPAVRDAIVDKDIQNALTAKISRERVGVELDKMLKGQNPLLSLQMIDNLSLHEAIFWLPKTVSDTLSSQPASRSLGLAASSILSTLLRQYDAPESPGPLPKLHSTLFSHVGLDKDVRRRLYLAASMTPFKGITYLEKKRQVAATEGLVRVGLKLGNQNHYMDGVPALFEASSIFSRPALERFTVPMGERAAIGLTLREKSVHNSLAASHWSSSLLFSLVQDLVETWDSNTGELEEKAATETITIYNAFVRRVEDLGLSSSVDDKPVLDGRQISSLLGLKPGPQTGKVLSRVVEWQLAHPGASRAECENWLKAEHESGKLLEGGASGDGKRTSGQDDRANKKAKTKG